MDQSRLELAVLKSRFYLEKPRSHAANRAFVVFCWYGFVQYPILQILQLSGGFTQSVNFQEQFGTRETIVSLIPEEDLNSVAKLLGDTPWTQLQWKAWIKLVPLQDWQHSLKTKIEVWPRPTGKWLKLSEFRRPDRYIHDGCIHNEKWTDAV